MIIAKIKFFIFSAFFIITLVAVYFAWQIYWTAPDKNSPLVSVEMTAGKSVAELARELKDKKIIGNQWLFKKYLSKKGLDKKLQVGLFDFQEGMSIKSVVAILGDPHVAAIKVFFREGDNVSEYAATLVESGLIAKNDDFEGVVGYPALNYCLTSDTAKYEDFSAQYDFLADKPKCIGLEGYLFPDTYFFAQNISSEDIAKKMLDNFSKKLSLELRAEINRQNKTIHEIITMASLIEAEARNDSDRKLVSGVLWRRLSVGMGLQLDSTVNYLTGNDKPAVSFSETQINSLYNTYKYRGLPPGPINNPSISSILAAVYPTKNDYWYFLADKQGMVHFSKTLEEHNILKYRYLK